MKKFGRLIKNLQLNEEKMVEYNLLLNKLLIKQFFGMLSIMLASILMFNTDQQYDMILLYAMFGTAAITSYYSMSDFVRICIRKKLISKVFPTEIFGTMAFSALLTFTAIHMLIWTGLKGWPSIIAMILNVMVLGMLLCRKTARPKMVAKRYQERLME